MLGVRRPCIVATNRRTSGSTKRCRNGRQHREADGGGAKDRQEKSPPRRQQRRGRHHDAKQTRGRVTSDRRHTGWREHPSCPPPSSSQCTVVSHNTTKPLLVVPKPRVAVVSRQRAVDLHDEGGDLLIVEEVRIAIEASGEGSNLGRVSNRPHCNEDRAHQTVDEFPLKVLCAVPGQRGKW